MSHPSPSITLTAHTSLPPHSLSPILSRRVTSQAKMSSEVVQEVTPPGCVIGEGPHWEASRGCLLFVDIVNAEMHRLFTKTGRHQVLKIEEGEGGQTVSFAIPVEGDDDLYVIGQGRSLSLVHWPESDPDLHTKRAKVTLHTVEGHTPTNRFNDAKCDPQGRLWAGTMGSESGPGVLAPHLGNLYRINHDLTLTTCVDKITLSNGLAWSADRKKFYYIDSMAYSVDVFDYNDQTGTIDNRRTLLDFKKAGLEKDIPDGMCVDSTGNLWVACFYGGKVICIDPTKQVITRKVTMPASNITSVCFGGDDLSTLYVTSASTGLTPEERSKQPAGSTFSVTGLGVTGLPPVTFKMAKGALQGKGV